MEEKNTQFYVHTKDNSVTRTIVVPPYVKSHIKRNYITHLCLAILIGVSVPYFVINFSKDMYHAVKYRVLGYSDPVTLEGNATNKVVNLGSDDADNRIDDVPVGKEVPVNPDQQGQYYFLGPNYKIPSTSALAFVISDVDTGEVIIEKNKDMILPIASVSKLITALVAMQNMDMHANVTISRSSVDTYGNTGGLHTGEKVLITDLFYPLLMESSNDAAEQLAESYGKEEFIKKMNLKAKELGMNTTSFDEPSGLSANNVSTAHDLQVLVQYITKEHPELWDITRVRQYAIKGHSWGNGSALSRKPNFLGGKNGFTYEANRTTASLFEVEMEGGKRRISVTLLKSNERERDVDALLRFLSKWVGYLPEGQEL